MTCINSSGLDLQFCKMLSFFQRVLDWIRSLFWKEEMELTLVGLQYSGKTTFVNVIAVGTCKNLLLLCIVYFAVN